MIYFLLLVILISTDAVSAAPQRSSKECQALIRESDSIAGPLPGKINAWQYGNTARFCEFNRKWLDAAARWMPLRLKVEARCPSGTLTKGINDVAALRAGVASAKRSVTEEDCPKADLERQAEIIQAAAEAAELAARKEPNSKNWKIAEDLYREASEAFNQAKFVTGKSLNHLHAERIKRISTGTSPSAGPEKCAAETRQFERFEENGVDVTVLKEDLATRCSVVKATDSASTPKSQSAPAASIDVTEARKLCDTDESRVSLDLQIAACTTVIQSGKGTKRSLSITFHNRGVVYQKQSRYDLAIADYGESIKLDPNYVDSLENQGYLYLDKGEYDLAIRDYDRAIELKPNDLSFTNRGIAYHNKNQYDRAIQDFDQAIKLNPNYVEAYQNRGIAYESKKDYARALLDYDKITQINPKYANAWNGRCWGRAMTGQLDQALKDCDEALRLAPSDKDIRDSRGFTYLKLGQLDNAIADYDAALKLDPKLATSLYGRGLAKQKKGDSAGGDVDIAAAKAIDGKIVETFAGYSTSAAAGNVGAVTPPKTQTVSAPAAGCSQAETHWKSAEDIKSLAVYEDHLARFPTCNFAALAKARIEALKK